MCRRTQYDLVGGDVCGRRRLSTLTLMTLIVVHWRLMNSGVVMVTGRPHQRRHERTVAFSPPSSSSLLATNQVVHQPTTDNESTGPLAATVAATPFEFHDCGEDNDRPIRILNVSVNPHPLRSPGKVKVSAIVNVTNQLPTALSADVVISKILFPGIPATAVPIPCYHNIGSCRYDDVCSLLDSFFPTDDDCPRVLRRNRLPCRCPIEPGLYHLARYSFHLPQFPDFIKALATGEFEITVRLSDQITQRELGCLQFRFDMITKRNRKHFVLPHRELN